ncbi:MAG: GNAT family N-acetyltransferase [Bacteroidetes bacterium]|nr:GNAT family N-acetyltransferase [Bacteroidota bacterium]
MMTYHLATENDFNEVFDMYMDNDFNKYLTYDLMSRENFKPIYNGLLKRGTLYVAKENDQIVGTYQLVAKTDRQAHIYYLGSFTIKKEMQGKGLAKEILSAIKKDAATKKKKRIELTVDMNNLGAIALYEKMGFEVEGVIRKNYRLASTGQYYDEYLMGLIL